MYVIFFIASQKNIATTKGKQANNCPLAQTDCKSKFLTMIVDHCSYDHAEKKPEIVNLQEFKLELLV